MSILQISKIQHRAGNLVDLPQLDDAELGWASDAKRLFIGKTQPNENIEVLTSYSQISFSQIDGSEGANLNIVDSKNGQILGFDGDNWVNKGGQAGGLITLGDVSNVKIDGGALSYVLETDGLGNLSWTPKSSIIAYIENVTIGNGTAGNRAIVTTTEDNLFTDGLKITITNAYGMTQLNGESYFANVITSNTFALYTDSDLLVPLNNSAFTPYAYTNVTSTASDSDQIRVTDASSFSVNDPVRFTGDLTGTNLKNDTTYYIKTIGTTPGSNYIIISATIDEAGVAGPIFDPGTKSSITGVSVYAYGGRLLYTMAGTASTSSYAAGSNTWVQYSNSGILGASPNFRFDSATNILTVDGSINTTNMTLTGNIQAARFISTANTGTAPLVINSTTRVANLNVAYANVSDHGVVNTATTGTFYPTFVNGSSNGNFALNSNAALSFNAANGTLTSTNLTTGNVGAANLALSGSAAIVGNITAGNVTANGNVSGTILISTVATGNAPLVVNSTTKVSNLRADTAETASTIVIEDRADSTTLQYPTFVTGTSNGTAVALDSALSYLPSTNTLSAGNVEVAANLSAGNLAVSGLANVGSTLTVSGNIVGQANASINGNVNANNATITNRVTSSSLSVTDTANINNLNVAGNTLQSGRITVTGNAIFTSPNVSLGPVSNLHITGGADRYLLSTDGLGGLSFVSPESVASPGGSNTTIQFNDAGGFGGSTSFTFNKTTGNLVLNGNAAISGALSAGSLAVAGAGSVGTNFSVGGNSAVAGNANVGINLSVTGSGSFGGNITATGNGAIGGNLSVTGSQIVSGNLTVSGNTRLAGLSASGNVTFTGSNVNLGSIDNLSISGGGIGYVLTTNGSGDLAFVSPTSVGRQPGGSTTQVQFNDGGEFGGDAGLTFNKTTNDLAVGGNLTVGGAITTNGITTTSASINSLTVTGTGNFQSNVNVSGTVTAGRYNGNGAGLTNIPGANVVGAVGAVNGNIQGTMVGDIVWNNNTNFIIRGESTFDVYSGGRWGVWDGSGYAIQVGHNERTIIGQAGSKGLSVIGPLDVAGTIYQNGSRVITISDFTNGSGWTKLPNGMILQYGTASIVTERSTTVFYPISFPNFSIAVLSGSNQSSSDGRQAGPGVTYSGTSYFTAYSGRYESGPGTITGFWIAIGY